MEHMDTEQQDAPVPTLKSSKASSRARPPRRSKDSPAHRRRDNKRMEDHRRVTGNAFQNEVKARLREKLFAGTTPQSALAKIDQSIVKYPIHVSISTRGIGFAITHFFAKTTHIKNLCYGQATIYMYYRVYLAFVELRLREINSEKVLLDRYQGQVLMRDASITNVVYALASAPEYVAVLLQQLGILSTNEKIFVPTIAPLRRDREDRLIPSPETILYSTLQAVTRSLSSEQTPLRYRKLFRDNSPLPGAKWDENNVLLNAADFWPQNYDLDVLQREINIVSSLNATVQRQFPKLIGIIDKTGGYPGTRAMLISNDMEDLRQVEIEDLDLPDYYKVCHPAGNVKFFRSSESVTGVEALLGQMCLLGETTPYTSGYDPFFIPRLPPACCYEYVTGYQAALQVIFGG